MRRPGSFGRKKAIEKTILCIFGSSVFPRSLGLTSEVEQREKVAHEIVMLGGHCHLSAHIDPSYEGVPELVPCYLC
jgi:hypothetical protein